MWIVELNIAGYRLTREVPELRGRLFRSVRLGPRRSQGHVAQLPQSQVA